MRFTLPAIRMEHMTEKDDISPIRKQYLQIKRQYPDTILFFRLGDFYETFDQDAEITARELDIVLTSRNVAKGVRVPMAGIPYHAVENYLARLIEKGFHVAICEQMGEEPVKGLFPRQVVRVVTPGTVMEPGLLPGDANNYLVCVVLGETGGGQGGARAGVAYVDITTGEFAATELSGTDIGSVQTALRAELHRLKPAEILHPDGLSFAEGIPGHATAWPAWRFEPGRCQEELLRHFQVGSLDGFGLRGLPLAIRSAGAILQYLQETQPAALALLNRISTYTLNDFMTLDAATRRNLELTEAIRGGTVKGSLLGILDATVTPMGKRLIRQWVSKPLLDVNRISRRQDGVEFFFENGLLRAEVRAMLKPLVDLERLTNRVAGGNALPRDLAAMRATLQRLPALRAALPESGGALAPVMKDFDLCAEELSLLESALADDPPATLQTTGVIRPGYSAELDGVVERSRHARDWIASLESVERERTGIKSLKVGYNKVFGYYIEITRAKETLVPPEYIRKQTLVNAERYITPEMKEYEALVLNAEERIREIEVRLFKQVCAQLAGSSKRLLGASRSLAALDVLAALAEAAAQGRYVRPEVTREDVLEIKDGRHPVVEQGLTGERFVPNDTAFEPGEIVRIITGPNMSGKSTFLRQSALIVLMAQMGSFVPASAQGDLEAMGRAVREYGIELPDRQLACAPLGSPAGREYLAAMAAAANYAWANRQVIANSVRRCFEQVFGSQARRDELPLLYDVCHNIAKVERHRVDGRELDLCVHRKGATRAFGPGRPEVPAVYRDLGQPVLIPGNMASGSYILVGTNEAMESTFGSTCHGAGRVMSRHQARKQVRGEQLRKELEGAGIAVRAGSLSGLAEEGPHAYKELDHVVEIVHQAGIARQVVRTRPLGVMKG